MPSSYGIDEFDVLFASYYTLMKLSALKSLQAYS